MSEKTAFLKLFSNNWKKERGKKKKNNPEESYMKQTNLGYI